MTREQARALLELPREQAIAAILALAHKAEQWERLHNTGEDSAASPTAPSAMRPVYTKPAARGAREDPGASAAIRARAAAPLSTSIITKNTL
jgi:transposase